MNDDAFKHVYNQMDHPSVDVFASRIFVEIVHERRESFNVNSHSLARN